MRGRRMRDPRRSADAGLADAFPGERRGSARLRPLAEPPVVPVGAACAARQSDGLCHPGSSWDTSGNAGPNRRRLANRRRSWRRARRWPGLAGCTHSKPARNLDLDAIRVSPDARLRTDTVGDGPFASNASFVPGRRREHRPPRGAHVTLGGELADAAGTTVGELKSQSLWIPPHEGPHVRPGRHRAPRRPTAAAARIKVKGALIPDDPPRAHISDLHSFDDHGKIVVQAYLVNAADRPGQIMAIGSFHDAHGQPMTRPFSCSRSRPAIAGSSSSSAPRARPAARSSSATPCTRRSVCT